MGACRDYVAATRRRISFEYALMDGVNDSDEQAHQLADLLKGLLAHVNLIPLNPTHDSPYRGSPNTRVRAFSAVLESRSVPTTVRLRRGIDIQAGCGQLRARYDKGTR
jgi:23S rRNA (adenine2503-C2)-methyltransferase